MEGDEREEYEQEEMEEIEEGEEDDKESIDEFMEKNMKKPSFSKVPLAKSKFTTEEQEQGDDDDDEENVVEAPIPPPTRFEQNKMFAEAMAKNAADSAQERMKQNNAKARSARKEFEKMTKEEEVIMNEAVRIAQMLNDYRKEYKGKINHTFKTNYTSQMGLVFLKAERASVENILNTQDVPTMIGNLIKKGAEWLQDAARLLNNPKIDLTGPDPEQTLTKRMESLVDNGGLKEEIKQISIKYAWIFAQPPEVRAAGMIIGTIGNTLVQNIPISEPPPHVRQQKPDPKYADL